MAILVEKMYPRTSGGAGIRTGMVATKDVEPYTIVDGMLRCSDRRCLR